MDLQTLTADEVLEIHHRLVTDPQITDEPIPPGILSRAMLESAVGRQHTAHTGTLKYPDPIDNAATLAYGITCDHAFENGNKRTALVAMLVHLDKNKICLLDVGQKEAYDTMIALAKHQLSKSKRGSNGSADDEVKALSNWIRDHAKKIKRGDKEITYRELERCLNHFGYSFESPSNSFIDIVRYEDVPVRGLFTRTIQRRRIHVMNVGFPGKNQNVGIKVLKQIRAVCKLTEEDGVDSENFYGRGIMVDAFINKYRKTLCRLARN